MRVIALRVSKGVKWVVLRSTFIDIWVIECDITVIVLLPVKHVIFPRGFPPQGFMKPTLYVKHCKLCSAILFLLIHAPTGNHGAREGWVDRNPLWVFVAVRHKTYFTSNDIS